VKKGYARYLLMIGGAAVVAVGILVVLSLLEGGGSQGTYAGVPQEGTRLGEGGAPVTIRLYEDFQCAYCGVFAREALPEVVERHVKTGDAKIVAETLSFLGPDSVAAGRAALAAGEQDLYWQYAALLFERQGAENSGYATDRFLTRIAEDVEGLDVAVWEEASEDPAVEGELAAVTERANRAGVNSTPTLVVSGPRGERTLRGAVPAEEVASAIEAVSAP
jgi:protein-disulfide isomerase